MIAALTRFLRRLTRRAPPDPAMDALKRQLAYNRAHHLPNRDVIAAQKALVHSQLARSVGREWPA